MTGFSAAELLARHNIAYRQTRTGKYSTACPDCNEGYLDVKIDSKGAQWHCQSCKQGDGEYFEQHDKRNKPTVDLSNPKAVYDYVDESGARLFQVLRFETDTGLKVFRQRTGPDQKPWSIKGVRIVPYRLPELVEDIARGSAVFVVEGEKDVDNLRRRGFPATCNPMGAKKWWLEFNKILAGADVIICGDNDEPGREHVALVARNLRPVVKRLSVLDLASVWPEIEESQDISDWFAAGLDPEHLVALVEGLPDWTPAKANGHDDSPSASSARAAAASGASPSNDVVTEDNVARRFAELYEGALRFCHDTGAWFKFDGNLWRQNRVGVAFQWARELARGISKDEPDKTRFITSKTSFAAGVERYARSDPTFATVIDFWDQDQFLLGTPGGTVDLKNGKLRLGRPEDGITKSTAIAPATIADCPLWLRFLEETTGGDAEMIRFLQQWCGYSLTGDVREHALVFVFGNGGNGKSVFVNAVTGILASYATVATMDAFIASHNDRHSTELAMLRGARLVTASETEEGRPWAEARIKQLTGGDAVTARFMRQDNFTFKPSFKLTIIGNHKPTLHSVDDAQRRRFNLVPFTRKPDRPDHRLEEKLKAEWPSILRWMIEGCLDWQANGLVRPTSVLDATAQYFADQDLMAHWLEELCDAEPGNPYKSATSADLFKSWTAFAVRSGEKPGNKRMFAESMGRRGFENKRGTGGIREYRGVRLKPVQTDHSDA